MLKDDFYSCTDVMTADGEYSCKILFNGDHDIFKGHFPGNPVVPGVCTMAIVKELLQLQVGKPLVLRSTGNVKFLQLVTPDVTPVITINWKADGEGYVVKASLTKDEVALFKFDGNYLSR